MLSSKQETTGVSGQLNPDGDEDSVSIATGESTKQAEKTIACGTPDDVRHPW